MTYPAGAGPRARRLSADEVPLIQDPNCPMATPLAIDINQDGRANLAVQGFDFTSVDINRMFDLIDRNHDGVIDREEWDALRRIDVRSLSPPATNKGPPSEIASTQVPASGSLCLVTPRYELDTNACCVAVPSVRRDSGQHSSIPVAKPAVPNSTELVLGIGHIRKRTCRRSTTHTAEASGNSNKYDSDVVWLVMLKSSYTIKGLEQSMCAGNAIYEFHEPSKAVAILVGSQQHHYLQW